MLAVGSTVDPRITGPADRVMSLLCRHAGEQLGELVVDPVEVDLGASGNTLRALGT